MIDVVNVRDMPPELQEKLDSLYLDTYRNQGLMLTSVVAAFIKAPGPKTPPSTYLSVMSTSVVDYITDFMQHNGVSFEDTQAWLLAAAGKLRLPTPKSETGGYHINPDGSAEPFLGDKVKEGMT